MIVTQRLRVRHYDDSYIVAIILIITAIVAHTARIRGTSIVVRVGMRVVSNWRYVCYQSYCA